MTGKRSLPLRTACLSCAGFMMLAFSSPSFAGLIEVSVTAQVELDGGELQDVGAIFVLDNSVFAPVGQYTESGALVGASLNAGDYSVESNPDSSFNWLYGATLSDGRGAVQIVADGPDGIFGIELFSDDWFNTNNIFDVLTTDLTLDDVDPFDLNSYSSNFTFTIGSDIYTVGMSSLSISASEIPEPGTAALILLVVPLLVRLRRHQKNMSEA